jgi:hypothetical protein
MAEQLLRDWAVPMKRMRSDAGRRPRTITAALYSQTVASQISTPARISRTRFSPIIFASPRLR